MPLLRTLLMRAARRVAADPRVQAKAADLYHREVKPRAEAAWEDAKPKLDAARRDLGEIARETDPRRDPKGFAKKVKQRFIDRDEER